MILIEANFDIVHLCKKFELYKNMQTSMYWINTQVNTFC